MTVDKKWKKEVRKFAAAQGVTYREAEHRLRALRGRNQDLSDPSIVEAAAPKAPEPAPQGPEVSTDTSRPLANDHEEHQYDEKADYFSADPNETYEFWIMRGRRRVHRSVRVGAKYVVEPFNPQKTKHRGRVGIVIKLRYDFVGSPHRVSMKFIDGKGPHGVVDASDLRELTKDEEVAIEQGTWRPGRIQEPKASADASWPMNLGQSRFSPETGRPPLAETEALWGAAKEFSDPAVCADPASDLLLKKLFVHGHIDPLNLAASGVARWLPSSAEVTCRWWGSARERDAYRLGIQAYEADGTLGSLCALPTAELRRLKTGEPRRIQLFKWPRPWNTDGLFLADRVGRSLLQGFPPKSLCMVFITTHPYDFLLFSAECAVQSKNGDVRTGVLCLPSGTHIEHLMAVKWPQRVSAMYLAKRKTDTTGAALRRLRTALGAQVQVGDYLPIMKAVAESLSEQAS